MWWLSAWHWLCAHSLWNYVIGWFVAATLTTAAGWLPWRRHRKAQATIEDRLDTSTPGGVTEVIEAIKGTRR